MKLKLHQCAIIEGGTVEDKGQPWVISYWDVPNQGHAVDLAAVRNVFLDDKEAADRIAKRYDGVPEMAFVLSREQYNDVKRQAAKNEERYQTMLKEIDFYEGAYSPS